MDHNYISMLPMADSLLHFYEPSTRTRLSFESAMLSLGGQTLGFSSAAQSSASKGETVADTARVVRLCRYNCDETSKEGAPLQASIYSRIPIINAGDGGHAHPTQTLIDMMTIRQRKGKLNNLTIGFCGDLKFGRTVHSLVSALLVSLIINSTSYLPKNCGFQII